MLLLVDVDRHIQVAVNYSEKMDTLERPKNLRVYGQSTCRKIIASAVNQHVDVLHEKSSARLKTRKDLFNSRNSKVSTSSSDVSENDSTFERLQKGRRYFFRRETAYKPAYVTSFTSNTESEVSIDRSGSIGLFKTPKGEPKSVSKPQFKCKHKKKTKKIKNKRNKSKLSTKTEFYSSDDSQEFDPPAEYLMEKYDVRKENGPNVKENDIDFSEFDNFDLVVESLNDEEKMQTRLNYKPNRRSEKENQYKDRIRQSDSRSLKLNESSVSLKHSSTPLNLTYFTKDVRCNLLKIPDKMLNSVNNVEDIVKMENNLRNSMIPSKRGFDVNCKPVVDSKKTPKDHLNMRPFASTPQTNATTRIGQTVNNLSPVIFSSAEKSVDCSKNDSLSDIQIQLNNSWKAISELSDRSKAIRPSLDDIKLKMQPSVQLEKMNYSLSMFSIKSKQRQSSKLRSESKINTSFLYPTLTTDCLQQTFHETISVCVESNINSAKQMILKQCRQKEPISFMNYLKSQHVQKKVGEGTYGEVFLLNQGHYNIVAKIIPIEGDKLICDMPQKTFQEILSEVVVSIELSSLRDAGYDSTPNFVLVNGVSCLTGKYPEVLLDAWNEYDSEKGSENENPEIFLSNQLYISFEFSNGGTDLENYQFSNAKQGISVFIQVALSLAVAENKYKFEHRDLHWGNILVAPTSDDKIIYSICGEQLEIDSSGVLATIIDFTLSRFDNDGFTMFCDLSTEDNACLFEGKGDHQFEIYRKMKQQTRNKWNEYHPYTNILWLHYLVKKLLLPKKYINKRSKVHLNAIKCLKYWEKNILKYKSCNEFIYKSDVI